MTETRFLRTDGSIDRPKVQLLGAWLPSPQQMSDAIQFRVEEAVGPDPAGEHFVPGVHTSMRQGMVLVLAVGLIAGALPFVVNWVLATRAGTALPLLSLAQSASVQSDAWPWAGTPAAALFASAQQIAGLEPVGPGWLAALLSSFGGWLTAPFTLLTIWLAYGVGVLTVALFLGAKTGLQRFLAATSYAALPLVLTTLAPIPCLGGLANLVAVVWSALLYIATVRLTTRLDTGRAVICILAPAGVLISVGVLWGGIMLTLLALLA